MKSKSGFTIIELLVVIVVIAILATISVISYVGIQDRAKFTAMISTIDSYEKIFRSIKAETGNYPATMVYDTSINGYVYHTKLNSIYTCLTPDTTLPATADFKQDSCYDYTYNGTSSTLASLPDASFIAQLKTITPTLPKAIDMTAQISDSGATANIRGIMYGAIDTTSIGGSSYPVITYFYKGSYGCPRGQKADFDLPNGQKATMCQLALEQ